MWFLLLRAVDFFNGVPSKWEVSNSTSVQIYRRADFLPEQSANHTYLR